MFEPRRHLHLTNLNGDPYEFFTNHYPRFYARGCQIVFVNLQ